MKSVRSVLLEQGFIAAHEVPNSSLEFRVQCPECHNPKKKCYVSAEGGGINCFHCGYNSGWRTFARRYYPLDPKEQALDEFVEKSHELLSEHEDVLQYLFDRGLTEETIIKQKIGLCLPDSFQLSNIQAAKDAGLCYADGQFVLNNRIIIPYFQDGATYTVRGRIIPGVNHDVKMMGLKGVSPGLFIPNGVKIKNDEPVYVTEGEWDTLILNQNGFQAIGIAGAQNSQKEWFKHYKNLYIALDGDEAGKKGVSKLVRDIHEVRVVNMPEDYDVNKYILKFGPESFKSLASQADLFIQGKKQRDDRFSSVIEDFSNWAWSNGEIIGPRILWSPKLEKAFLGWSPGLYLLGAESQSGKTRLLLKSLYELCVENPDDTVGVYLSFDDTIRDAASGILALHTGITMNEVKTPRWSFDHPDNPSKKSPEKLQKYIEGVDSLKEIDNLVLRDATYGRSVQYLRYFFENLRKKYQNKHIVVFIDSLAKITPEGSKEVSESGESQGTNFKAFLARELKYFSSMYNLAIITPTDLRKLNGRGKPTLDDLKDAAELRYEATNIMLMYNDMSVHRDASQMVKIVENVKYPVVEVIIPKNKASGKETVIRYVMNPAVCEFEELTGDDDLLYARRAAEQELQRAESRRGNRQ